MSLATKPVDGAGSKYEYTTDDGTTWIVLPGLDVIPEIGSGDEWDDVTDIHQDEREFEKKALTTPPELELVLRDIPGNADQKGFTDLVEARTLIPSRVTSTSGRIQNFNFEPQNHKFGELGKEQKAMFAAIGLVRNLTSGVSA